GPLRFAAVAHHRHAERTGDGDRLRACGEELLGALDVDPFALTLFHPHPPAAGAATQAAIPGARRLDEIHDWQRAPERLARRVVNVIVSAEVARIVVRHR